MVRTAVAIVLLCTVIAPQGAAASAAQLPDGTRVQVRLVTFINSDDSKAGDAIEFVVVRDVVVDDVVVIAQGTRVLGTVVKARRARRGFASHHHARLAFVFTYTAASNGELVRLRGSSSRRPDHRVEVDRRGLHHELQWTGAADTFDAFVDGSYEI
jgi:hypothetical protein